LKAGHHRQCHEFFQKAIALAPESPAIYSCYLNSLNCSDLLTQSEWFAEHCKYDQIVAAKAEPFIAHDNLADPERRLRVGYVSADLRHHSVASFFEPLIANHNRENFEVFCYYNNHTKDVVTDRIKAMADHWCDCILLTDAELAARIRADKIDLLIDLTGHTAYTRLTVFAWKPAPVQFTWLGYGPTTGVKAIDYIFVDRYYVSDDEEAQYFVEQPVFLKNYRVFQAPADLPIKPLPALHNGYVTFGSFNSFVKVSHSLLSLWADILDRVPDSRLSIIIESAETTRSVKDYFLSRGIAEERLMLFNKLRYDHFLQLHYYVDIALDTYPFNGFTTSFNGLWMGVPMLTQCGPRMASKTGKGLLSQLGLQEFIASNAEEYVEKACQWAARLPQLSEIRTDLRERMRRSTLMDNALFAQDFERILRDCWIRWCAEKNENL
jgi:predicted O-linked N-acetylglucosamine transferase (SPINDLY family)